MNRKQQKQLVDEINEALKKLGYEDGDRIRIRSAGIDRYELSKDGEAIGIWDSRRKTFVD